MDNQLPFTPLDIETGVTSGPVRRDTCYDAGMDNDHTSRESRSVRLSAEEWELAEAVAHVLDERPTAGTGLRTALALALRQVRSTPEGRERLREAVAQIRRRRG
jgi:hypothetical protein